MAAAASLATDGGDVASHLPDLESTPGKPISSAPAVRTNLFPATPPPPPRRPRLDAAATTIQRWFRHRFRLKLKTLPWYQLAIERKAWLALAASTPPAVLRTWGDAFADHRHPPFPSHFMLTPAEADDRNLPLAEAPYAFVPRGPGCTFQWTLPGFLKYAPSPDAYSPVPEALREERKAYTTSPDVVDTCFALLADMEASHELADFFRAAGLPGWCRRYRSDAFGNVVSQQGKAITGFAVDHIFPVSRGGRNAAVNVVALHWGANGDKSDAVLNWMDEATSDRLSCGLQHTDLMSLGAVVDAGEATWEQVDAIIRTQQLPRAGNRRSFQTYVRAAPESSRGHGFRVWAALQRVSDERRALIAAEGELYTEGTRDHRWLQHRHSRGLPTRVRVLADRPNGSLLAGRTYYALGWAEPDEDNPSRPDWSVCEGQAYGACVVFVQGESLPGRDRRYKLQWRTQGAAWEWEQ